MKPCVLGSYISLYSFSNANAFKAAASFSPKQFALHYPHLHSNALILILKHRCIWEQINSMFVSSLKYSNHKNSSSFGKPSCWLSLPRLCTTLYTRGPKLFGIMEAAV